MTFFFHLLLCFKFKISIYSGRQNDTSQIPLDLSVSKAKVSSEVQRHPTSPKNSGCFRVCNRLTSMHNREGSTNNYSRCATLSPCISNNFMIFESLSSVHRTREHSRAILFLVETVKKEFLLDFVTPGHR